jgi:hypothetical protein
VYWVSTPDSGIQVAAREGSAAPGAVGANFNVLDPLAVINGQGQVALTASLVQGGEVTAANDRGLWAGLPGELNLVAREGDVIDLDPTGGELLKTIQAITFANGYSSPNPHSSASAAFNDAGQIAWQATFTDSSTAVFRTLLPSTQPEPSADFDDDGDVDGSDYLVWQRGLGTLTGATRTDGNANAAEDGDVDGDDLQVWIANFGASESAHAVSTVPEPATISMLLIAAAMLSRTAARLST